MRQLDYLLARLGSGLLLLLTAQLSIAQSPVVAHGQLKIAGNQLVNQFGNPVSLAGNSLFWSNTGWGAEGYYQAATLRYLQSNWDASIVRAAMGVEEPGGYIHDPQGNMDRVRAVIDGAIDLGLYVIVDWHSHRAEQYQAQAIEFFRTIATEYGDRPNVVYELYNEPIAQSWPQVIKPYAEAVTQAIRQVDPDNLILVGSSTWSQDVDVAAADPLEGENIAYTVHFYAGTHGDALREKIDRALGLGAAVIVSEWGSVNANGDGAVAVKQTQVWMDFLRERGLSHLNWSVHNKDEGASVFQPGASDQGGWTDDDLSESGLLVRDIIRRWSRAGLTINAGMSGAWYNPDTDGQGWLLDVIDQGPSPQVFVAWFTYDTTPVSGEEPVGFGSPRHRWFVASGPIEGGEAELDIYLNRGGVFNQPEPTQAEVVGSLSISFDSCVRGQLSFDFGPEQWPPGVVNIVRLSPDTFCRTQAAQAR